MNKLLNFIEDDDLQKELEQVVLEELSDTDLTLLTNANLDEERQKFLLQIYTYKKDDLYCGEIVVPDGKTVESTNVELFRIEVNDMVRAISEAFNNE